MATSLSPSSSPPPFHSIFKLKPCNHFGNDSLPKPLLVSTPSIRLPFRTILKSKVSRLPREASLSKTGSPISWRLSAVSSEDASTLPTDSVVAPAAGDDGVSSIISILLFIALVGLSILTIGVIYIAVTDFLQKREREKFEKEEAAKKKKDGKKGKVRARAGPRGFGQKIDEDEDDD